MAPILWNNDFNNLVMQTCFTQGKKKGRAWIGDGGLVAILAVLVGQIQQGSH